MTVAGRQILSVEWQTWIVVAGTVVGGRWLAGGGFGYTLFAVVWAPLAALSAVSSHSVRDRTIAAAGLAALFSLVWWVGWPWFPALRLTGWLTLFIGTAVSVKAVFHFIGLSRHVASGLTALLWTTWVSVPLLMAGDMQPLLGDAGLGRMLVVNPILLANAADTTAGDWTHQSIAYAHLTRLGQDIPLSWGRNRLALLTYGGITFIGVVLLSRTVVNRLRRRT